MTEPEPISEFRKQVKADYWSALFKDKKGLPLPLCRTIGGILLGGTKRRFDTRTAPNGKLWPALKFPRVSGGNRPLLDTGMLRNSLTMDVNPDGATVRTNLIQANTHNYGAVIKPVRAKFLSIPLTLAAKRAASPRRFRGKLFYVKPKPGSNNGGTLCESKGGKVTAHYLLLRSVTIPERRFMGVSREDERQIDEVLDDWILNQQRG